MNVGAHTKTRFELCIHHNYLAITWQSSFMRMLTIPQEFHCSEMGQIRFRNVSERIFWTLQSRAAKACSASIELPSFTALYSMANKDECRSASSFAIEVIIVFIAVTQHTK